MQKVRKTAESMRCPCVQDVLRYRLLGHWVACVVGPNPSAGASRANPLSTMSPHEAIAAAIEAESDETEVIRVCGGSWKSKTSVSAVRRRNSTSRRDAVVLSLIIMPRLAGLRCLGAENTTRG